jgi:hypothetical protein
MALSCWHDAKIATGMAKKKAKNPHAVALGRKGGLAAAGAGARAMHAALTPEQRSERAKRAALKRWAKKKSR